MTQADPVGIAPQASSTGTHESISLSSGSNSVFIPALSLPQRNGWNLTLGYLHNSNTWSMQQDTNVAAISIVTSGLPTWVDQYTYTDFLVNKFPGGLQINLPMLQASMEYMGDAKLVDANGDQFAQNPVFCITNFIFTDWSGNKHSFTSTPGVSNIATCNTRTGRVPPLLQGFIAGGDRITNSVDGSWLRLDLTNLNDLRVTTKDGTVYHFANFVDPWPDKTATYGEHTNREPYYQGVFSSMVDTNGNTVSVQTTLPTTVGATPVYDLTDTIGRKVRIVANGVPYTDANGVRQVTPGSISYTDSNGKSQTINLTMNLSSTQETYSFPDMACSYDQDEFGTYPHPPGNPTVNTFPTSKSLTLNLFSMDLKFPPADSNGNRRSYHLLFNGLGQLIKAQYPSGGYTRYHYQTFASQQIMGQVRCSIDLVEVDHKYECASSTGSCSQEQVTTYAPTTAGDLVFAFNGVVDVTDPTGVRVNHAFANLAGPGDALHPQLAIRETDTKIYDASGNLQRTTHTDYTPGVPFLDLQQPQKVTTTLNDVSPALSSFTQYQYDAVSNPTEIDVYDFDGSLKSKTMNVWESGGAFDSNHVLDRLASKTVEQFPVAASTPPSGGQQPPPDPASTVPTVTSYSYDTAGNVLSQSVSGPGVNTLTTSYVHNGFGQVTQMSDPNGNVTKFDYSDNWKDKSCAPASNSSAYLTQVTDALQHVSQFQYYSCTGLKAVAQDPNDVAAKSPGTVTTYDAVGRPLTVTEPDGGQTSSSYNDAVPLSVTQTTVITSALSQVHKTVFDGFNRAIQTQLTSDPAGTDFVDTTYDALGRKATVSNPYRTVNDPTYGLTTNQYDALGRVTQVTKQDSSVSKISYSGNCSTSTDEAGNQRRTCSDGLDRLIEVDEPGGSSAGSTASGTLVINGTLQSVSGIGAHGGAQAVGSVGIWSNSGNGGDSSIDDPNEPCPELPAHCPQIWDRGWVRITINGIASQTSYDANSNGYSLASALAYLINNSAANAWVTAQANGTAVNLQAKSAGAAGNSISVAFDSDTNDPTDFGGPSFGGSVTDMNGGADAFSGNTVYDAGTVTVNINGFSASVPYGQGGISTAAQVASALVSTGPTGLNRPGSVVSASANGATITLTYGSIGAAGNVAVAVVSSSSQTAYFSNPSFGSPGTTLSGGSDSHGSGLAHPYVTLYSYDGLKNLLSVTQKGDPAVTTQSQWRVRNFTYDPFSRLSTAQNPESGLISYFYDANGNLLQRVMPTPNQSNGANQHTISYCYDALNRITGKAYSWQNCQGTQLPAGTAVVSYKYDSGTNGIDHLTSWTDQAGKGSYFYDIMGRIASEQRTIAGIQKIMSYGYNLDGSVASIHYPSGNTMFYTPDSTGRAVSVSDNLQDCFPAECPTAPPGNNYVAAATYGPNGAPTGFVSGANSNFAGIANSFSYNSRLQPVFMSAASPSQTVFSIGYDFHLGNGDNGNVYGITNNKDNTRNQTFTYDQLNRLASAQNAGTDCTQSTANGKAKFWGNSYSYDAWGNLTDKTVTQCGSENLHLTADVQNRVHTKAGADFSYDAAGNMTYDASGLNYTYDAENRITGAGGFTYTYDDEGNRVEKSNGTTGTLYWYMEPGVVAESDLAGNLQSEYVFFNGQRVARKDYPSNAVSYYFSDHLKTASVITDSAGNIKSESDFYPWGGELQFLANDSNHYKFTGKERDGETGLDYFGARYYSNVLGRFVTPDWAAKPEAVPYAEFANPQSLNLYSYVRNNPLTLIDEDGHDCSGDVCTDVVTVPETMFWFRNRFGGITSFITLHTTVYTTTTNPDGSVEMDIAEQEDVSMFVSHDKNGATVGGVMAPTTYGDTIRQITLALAASKDPSGTAIHVVGDALADYLDENGVSGYRIKQVQANVDRLAKQLLKAGMRKAAREIKNRKARATRETRNGVDRADNAVKSSVRNAAESIINAINRGEAWIHKQLDNFSMGAKN
jgi:RHS repeat-associated protein